MDDRSLKQLVAIESRLSTLTDSSAALRLIVESAVQLTGASGGAFWIGDPSARDSAATLVCAIGSASAARDRLAVGAEAPVRERWTDEERRQRISSVPAIAAGRRRGVLIVFHPDVPPTDASESVLVLMASRAASVVASGECSERLSARDEFLSNAAHQLRTPISILRLELQGLERRLRSGSVSARSVDRDLSANELERAIKQCDHLSRVSEHLLELVELRTRRMHLNRSATELGAVVEEVALRLAGQLAHARSRLVMNIHPCAAGMWDRERLAQVAEALLMNVIKHAPGSLVEVSVIGDPSTAVLRVHDHGRGIAQEDLAHIFEGFERPASAEPGGGWGVGLLLCRRIVEGHGGTIRVISAPGQGSEFIVELPRGAPRDLRTLRSQPTPS
jgi:signal transduction histidine kinase